jgi:hypothetical protein
VPLEGQRLWPACQASIHAHTRAVVQVDGLSTQQLGGPGCRDQAESYERPRLLASRSWAWLKRWTSPTGHK